MLSRADINLRPLVILKVSDEGDSSKLAYQKVEPAFRIPGYRGLWQDTRHWNNEAAGYYAARSSRRPENLLNHVQRITHHIRQKNSEAVYGALLDLFIALKDRGQPLRARMLSYARPFLLEQQFDRFSDLLDTGITELNIMPPGCSSVLTRNYAGTSCLVVKLNNTMESEQNNSIEPGEK